MVLKAHRRQTEYAYRGRAKYTWTLRNTTVGECTLTPASGTIDEPVGVTVGLTRSGKRGYSYSGGNGAGGATGPIKEVCTDGTEDAHNGAIDGAFDPGGFSKNLRTFAGSEPGSSYHFKWSLVGK